METKGNEWEKEEEWKRNDNVKPVCGICYWVFHFHKLRKHVYENEKFSLRVAEGSGEREIEREILFIWLVLRLLMPLSSTSYRIGMKENTHSKLIWTKENLKRGFLFIVSCRWTCTYGIYFILYCSGVSMDVHCCDPENSRLWLYWDVG